MFGLEDVDRPNEPLEAEVDEITQAVMRLSVPNTQVQFNLYRGRGGKCFEGTLGGRYFAFDGGKENRELASPGTGVKRLQNNWTAANRQEGYDARGTPTPAPDNAPEKSRETAARNADQAKRRRNAAENDIPAPPGVTLGESHG